MAIAIIHSRQPANKYVGGSNENEQMYSLQCQAVRILRERYGMNVLAPDNSDYNRDGNITYADNVAWLRANRGLIQHVYSFHSNAAGDSMILFNERARSAAQYYRKSLNEGNIMPFGDEWTLFDRSVSELTALAVPSILFEFGRHDRADYAQWLRDAIRDGRLATWIADKIRVHHGIETDNPVKPAPIPTEPEMLRNGVGTKDAPNVRVRNLQSGLRRKFPLYAKALQIDGVYGERTERAVREFQRRSGLKIDGIVGARTRAELRKHGIFA